MNILRRISAIFFLCCFLISAAFAEEEKSPPSRPDKKLPLHALAGTLFSNVVVFSFNRFIAQSEFAMVTPQTIKNNFFDWEWDRDEFPTNMFAHPYHGSTYFASGRAAGFNFYESYLFAFVGSLTYELFTETTRPSINDLIISSVGGALLGEMAHRLYLEADSLWGILISPLDAFTNLIAFRRPEKTGGSNIYRLAAAGGPGWVYSEKHNLNDSRLVESWNTAAFNLDFDIIYGNPFEQQSWIPYEHFEFNFGGGIGPGWWDMHVVSDGYVFSFSPVNSETEKLSTGLSLNYDFYTSIYNFYTTSNINLTSIGLDWTAKYQRFFSGDSRMELKAHAGVTAIGGSLFYNDANLWKGRAVFPNYGSGANTRLFFSYFSPRRDRIDVELMLYALGIISYYKPEMQGAELFGLLNVSYAFPLGEHLSVGIADSLAGKAGLYTRAPDSGIWTNALKLFVAWNFIQKI